MHRHVYLGGPITGQDYKSATQWRIQVTAELTKVGIYTLDPLRGKESLRNETCLKQSYHHDPMCAPSALFKRDMFDLRRSDIAIFNFLNAVDIVSIGSVSEIARAPLYNTLVIIIMQEGNVHDHIFVRQSAMCVVPTLEQAIKITIQTLR